MKPAEVVIIGGGPGGLLTAYLLRRAADVPLRITLLEASDRLGGKVMTKRFAKVDSEYEAGAAELYDYSPVDDDPLRELIESLGISTFSMEGAAVVFEDRIVANLDDLRRGLGSSAVDALCAFDLAAKDTITPREFYESGASDELLPNLAEPDFDRCLDSIRDPRTRRFVETMIHSDLASEPTQTGVTYGLQNYLMNDGRYMRLYGLIGGMESFPRELVKRIDAQIHLHQTAHSITMAPSGSWKIETRSDDRASTLDSDYVVIALPIEPLKQLTWGDPELERAMHEHLKHFDHPAHYLRVTLRFDRPYWRSHLADSFFMLDRFGGCCLYDESSRRVDERFGMLGFLIAGDAARDMASWSDDAIVQAVCEAIPTALRDSSSPVLDAAVHRWIGAVSARPGGRTRRGHELSHRPARSTHPNLYVVGDYLFDTTLNGVLDSATYVAESLASRLNEVPFPR